jgi:hypothetical protein
MQVKKGLYSLEEARLIAYNTDQENKHLKELNTKDGSGDIYTTTYKKLEELKFKFIKQFLKEELLGS